MEGTIWGITETGNCVMYLTKLGDKKYGRTYTGEKYRNYINWKDLKVGDEVSGLVWKDENRGLVDGDSPVHLI